MFKSIGLFPVWGSFIFEVFSLRCEHRFHTGCIPCWNCTSILLKFYSSKIGALKNVAPWILSRIFWDKSSTESVENCLRDKLEATVFLPKVSLSEERGGMLASDKML